MKRGEEGDRVGGGREGGDEETRRSGTAVWGFAFVMAGISAACPQGSECKEEVNDRLDETMLSLSHSLVVLLVVRNAISMHSDVLLGRALHEEKRGASAIVMRLRGGESNMEGQREAMEERELYGGAIRIHMPATFQDISAFRPVPDFQETFGHLLPAQSLPVPPDSISQFSNCQVWVDRFAERSLIVELLEYDESVKDCDIATETDNSTDVRVISTRNLKHEEVTAREGGAGSAHRVCRTCKSVLSTSSAVSSDLRTLQTDMAIILHVTSKHPPGSQSLEEVCAVFNLAARLLKVPLNQIKSENEKSVQLMSDMMKELRVLNWDLFGNRS
eukprot:764090-Hanusia_phi.AAC.5